jgi:hypothetical protein
MRNGMKRTGWAVLWALVMVSGGVAQAETFGRGQGWSTLSGETVGAEQNVFMGQVGWPGIALTFLHGASNNVDLGGRFSFNYGEEGVVTNVVPGVKIQAVFRVKLVDTGALKFGIEFDPGPLFYFYGRNDYCSAYGCYYYGDGATEVGLALPFQFNFGLPIGSAFMANFGVWVPMWVTFGTGGGLTLPILFGGGLEYFLNSRFALSFNLHLGPNIYPASGRTTLALDAMFGIAYRF